MRWLLDLAGLADSDIYLEIAAGAGISVTLRVKQVVERARALTGVAPAPSPLARPPRRCPLG